MYIHVTRKDKLELIKKNGLRSRIKAGIPGGNSDKDKISVFYFADDVDKEILREARRIVYEGKNVNPYYEKYQENDYIVLKIDDRNIEWEYEERPVEMFEMIECSAQFYDKFKGYAKTTNIIPWKSIELCREFL